MTARHKNRFLAALWLALAVLTFLAASMLGPSAVLGTETALPTITVTAALPSGLPQLPELTSKAALVIDADSGQVLFSKNPDLRLPMASTTKIMTAILVLELLDLNTQVMVSRKAHFQTGSVVGLHALDVFTVERLLYWALVFSGNDAAVALAEKTAGSVEQFVVKMNQKATAMGLSNTHFVNVMGLDRTGHYSSCTDLAAMARYAMKNDTFRKIVKTQVYDLPHPGTYTPAEPKNSNALLSMHDWVTGVKTGSTPTAGYCLVASGTRDGISLMVVQLGAVDDATRWAEAEALFQYGFGLSPATALTQPGEMLAQVPVGDPIGQTVALTPKDQLATRLRQGEKATGQITLSSALTLPIRDSQVLGSVEFSVGERVVGKTVLVALAAVPIPTMQSILAHVRHWEQPNFQFALPSTTTTQQP